MKPIRIFAYCDQRYKVATKKVVGEGALIATSPPWLAHSVKPEWFTYKDIIYLDLHGEPGSIYMWSGPEQDIPALNAKMFDQVSVGGAVIIASTCYLPKTPFLRAFLEAGAEAVIGGDGKNWGNQRTLTGSQLLAADVIKALRAGVAVGEALQKAKHKLSRNWRRFIGRPKTRAAIADALEFKIFTGEDKHGRYF